MAIWRPLLELILEKISKDGDYHKRLQNTQIYAVKDFLKALNKDPNNLREVKRTYSDIPLILVLELCIGIVF